MLNTESSKLYQDYLQIQQQEKAPRQREAAKILGVSEGELVAAQVGHGVTRLRGEWLDILKEVESLGAVMALTRNDYAVIETDGVYKKFMGNDKMALVVEEGIDLRLFLNRWNSGFACVTPKGDSLHRSLQFFDKQGKAVHKIHLRPHSSVSAFDALVEKFADNNQATSIVVEEAEKEEFANSSDVDFENLRESWDAMTDPHQFFAITRKHKIRRKQALELAGAERARKIDVAKLESLLQSIADIDLSVLFFVGNRGCIEIFTGSINRVVQARGWLNVLDPGFNIHIQNEGMSEAWLVEKPSEEGVISSIEVFTPEGTELFLLFVDRKQGPEAEAKWKKLLATLPLAE